MELALSLGDTRKPITIADQTGSQQQKMKELGFCMVLGTHSQIQDHEHKINLEDDDKTNCSSSSSDPPPLQLDLRPFSPSLRQSPPPPPPPSHRPFPWLSQICKFNSLYFISK